MYGFWCTFFANLIYDTFQLLYHGQCQRQVCQSHRAGSAQKTCQYDDDDDDNDDDDDDDGDHGDDDE